MLRTKFGRPLGGMVRVSDNTFQPVGDPMGLARNRVVLGLLAAAAGGGVLIAVEVATQWSPVAHAGVGPVPCMALRHPGVATIAVCVTPGAGSAADSFASAALAALIGGGIGL